MRLPRIVLSLITHYPDYIGTVDLHKNDTIAELFSLASPEEIISYVKTVISSGRSDKLHNSLWFLRDLRSSPGIRIKDRKKLLDLIEKKGVYIELDKKLYTGNYQMRKDSIYTLGALYDNKYQKNMIVAFHKYYLKKDPYLTPSLIMEINRLGREHQYELLSCLVQHNHFAFRWSALSMDNCYNFEDKRVARLLSVLENDPVAAIRKDYLAKVKHGTRTTLTDYFSADIFVGNFLSFNRYKAYSLRLIGCLLNYYISNSKKFLTDVKRARGDSDAIMKVFLSLRNEIEKT